MKKKNSLSLRRNLVRFVFAALFAQAQTHAQELLPGIVVEPERDDRGTPSAVIYPSRSGSLEDSLRYSSGVEVTRAGGPGQPASLYLRGASAEHTLVLLDGVEVNDAGTPGGGFDFSSLDAGSIERIEIYKGPQSLRFGSGAMGGVVNIISKRGQGPRALSALARFGSFQTNRLGAGVSGGDEHSDYTLDVSSFESGGISAAAAGRELDGHRRFNAAARAGLRFGRSAISLSSRYLRSRTDLDYAPSNTPPYLAADDPNYHSVSQFFTNALNIKTNWAPGFDSRVTIARHDLNLDFPDPPDAANPSRFRERRSAATMKFENINDWKFTPNARITFGPSHRRERTVREMSMTGLFAAADLSRGIYTLNFGERFDHHSRFGSFFSHQIEPGLNFASAGTALKARFATAFKSPSLYQLYAPTFGNADLRPERTRGEELILSQALARDRMITLTAFQYHAEDLVQFGTRYENLRATRSRGFEAEYSGDVSPSWNLEAVYTFTEAKRLDTGAPLLRRPVHAWSAGTRYQIAPQWSARVRYQGKGRRADLDPLTVLPANNAGYDTLNLAVDFTPSPKSLVSLSAENAFDRHYQEVLGYGAPGLGVFLDLRTEL